MILSYNVIQKDQDSSTDSIKEEGINEIENIMNTNKKSNNNKYIIFISLDNLSQKTSQNVTKNEWSEEKISLNNSSQISKIDLQSQSISSSLKESLSRAEECIQKDILLVIDGDEVKIYYNLILFQKKNLNENNAKKKLESIESFNLSNENSFQSHGNKNYILKSDFLNTTESQNNISKEESFNKNINNDRFNQ